MVNIVSHALDLVLEGAQQFFSGKGTSFRTIKFTLFIESLKRAPQQNHGAPGQFQNFERSKAVTKGRKEWSTLCPMP